MLFPNFMTVGSVFLSLLLRASLISANINVYNWCSFDVYAYQVVSGDCTRGQDYECYANPTHLNPYVILSGSEKVFSLLSKPGAKIYLAKTMDIEHGILQFEYTLDIVHSTLFWDLSYVDGTASGVPGNYFDGENVTITPTGNISKSNCRQVNCPPADPTTECMEAYWHPTDDKQAMRSCPLDTGDMFVDLCGIVRPFSVQGTQKLRKRFNRSS